MKLTRGSFLERILCDWIGILAYLTEQTFFVLDLFIYRGTLLVPARKYIVLPVHSAIQKHWLDLPQWRPTQRLWRYAHSRVEYVTTMMQNHHGHSEGQLQHL
jgi:hypothetical protein